MAKLMYLRYNVFFLDNEAYQWKKSIKPPMVPISQTLNSLKPSALGTRKYPQVLHALSSLLFTEQFSPLISYTNLPFRLHHKHSESTALIVQCALGRDVFYRELKLRCLPTLFSPIVYLGRSYADFYPDLRQGDTDDRKQPGLSS